MPPNMRFVTIEEISKLLQNEGDTSQKQTWRRPYLTIQPSHVEVRLSTVLPLLALVAPSATRAPRPTSGAPASPNSGARSRSSAPRTASRTSGRRTCARPDTRWPGSRLRTMGHERARAFSQPAVRRRGRRDGIARRGLRRDPLPQSRRSRFTTCSIRKRATSTTGSPRHQSIRRAPLHRVSGRMPTDFGYDVVSLHIGDTRDREDSPLPGGHEGRSDGSGSDRSKPRSGRDRRGRLQCVGARAEPHDFRPGDPSSQPAPCLDVRVLRSPHDRHGRHGLLRRLPHRRTARVIGSFNKCLGWATTNSNTSDRAEICSVALDPDRKDTTCSTARRSH